MKYKVTKNMFVLGKLVKLGSEIEIQEKDLQYYKGNVEEIHIKKVKANEVKKNANSK